MSYLVPKWFRQPSSRRVLVTIKFKPLSTTSQVLNRAWSTVLQKTITSELLWKIFTLTQIQRLLCLLVFFFANLDCKKFEIQRISIFRLSKLQKCSFLRYLNGQIIFFEQFCQAMISFLIKIVPSKWSNLISKKNYLVFTNESNQITYFFS